MAKTKVDNAEVEIRVDSVTSIEDTPEQSFKKSLAEATVSNNKKTVKIRAAEDIDCLIACKPYRITKDKEASVPVDVAAILCHSKKAYRL